MSREREEEEPQETGDPEKRAYALALSLGTLPMPPPEELEMAFETFLEDLNLPEEKKEMMKKFPDDRRWKIIQQQMRDQLEDEETAAIEIQTDLDQLGANPTKDLLQSLSVALRSKPIHWINKFVELNGINALFNFQKNVTAAQRSGFFSFVAPPVDHPDIPPYLPLLPPFLSLRDDGLEELSMKCIKSLMNNSVWTTLPSFFV